MHISQFDFSLPDDRIALRPASPRDTAKLLVIPQRNHPFREALVRDLPQFLRRGDVLVVNDTRVIPAQLAGVRVRGVSVARIDVTLHKRETADRWRCFVRPAKRLALGERVRFGVESEGSTCLLASLDAIVVEKSDGGEVVLAFDLTGPALDEALMRLGHMPLPPYIAARRAEDDRDRQDYQTMFAEKEGAVAAPTAGLHFTPELTRALQEAGIGIERVTLHVGAGTFLPMKADDTADHKMHSEWGQLSAETAEALNTTRRAGGRIVCVGTTSLRLLETAVADDGTFAPWNGDTAIFITPGYRFKAADGLMTNFHLPRSTLFMLVSAFSGLDRMKAAYAYAIEQNYRFYSYGDASLLFRADLPPVEDETTA
jgi:S-adenosylmethionine:tRNA ribosyltransferase-isomerase